MPVGLVGFDKRARGQAGGLVGIDEAGRGSLAGPVVAAAVYCEATFYNRSWCKRNSRGVDDSKRLSRNQRATVVKRFRYAQAQGWIRIGIGSSSIEEIEKHNIFNANTLAMRRALEQVIQMGVENLFEGVGNAQQELVILIDGRPIRAFPLDHQGVVKGDRKSLAIALAGIHAKEHRDSLMDELDRQHPQYGFASHRGYGTEQHLEALRANGASPCHRPSFLKKLFASNAEVSELRQDSLF
jgi:ribonuclease HII